MEVSILQSKPPGMFPPKTLLIKRLEDAFAEVRIHLEAGTQALFICPQIDPSEKTAWNSVFETLKKVEENFPEFKVSALFGRQTPEEIASRIQDFSSGKIQVLVSTTVVEVGIDNPNVTVMVVENAECFGLSQLHQLRGRIGRGKNSSVCFFVNSKEEENPRLKVLENSTDGFFIASEDLRMRGPGDLVGIRQSGLFHPAFRNFHRLDLIEKARKRALRIITEDPLPIREWFRTRMKESFGNSFETFMQGG